jgi:hypothetical protein
MAVGVDFTISSSELEAPLLESSLELSESHSLEESLESSLSLAKLTPDSESEAVVPESELELEPSD